ncbi:MAG: gamma-glutamyl-gamma-aminobutyrate hydrolase family protein [Bacteriovoracia bacterium]
MRLAISACFFHADPQRPIFKGKTLQYLEQTLAHWVMSEGARAYLLPAPPAMAGGKVTLKDLVRDFDGLILHGGADVSPKSYGDTALKPEWNGDYVRDQYEIALMKEFMTQSKPVLGICRGLQLMNVALGGTLIQDIATQVPGAINHRNWEIYDQNFHAVDIFAASELAKVYPGTKSAWVNSVHHQAVKDLPKDFAVEARSPRDGVIEACRLKSRNYVLGVQWHPEFMWQPGVLPETAAGAGLAKPPAGPLLDPRPLLQNFMKVVSERK